MYTKTNLGIHFTIARLSSLMAIIALVMLIPASIYGQFGWEKTFGGDYSETEHIVAAHDGNIIMVGEDVGPGSSYNPLSDYITKFNIYGDRIWTKYLDSQEELKLEINTNEHYIGLKVDSILLNGSVERKAVIFKMDEDGNFLWESVISENLSGYAKVDQYKVLEDGAIVFTTYTAINDPNTYYWGVLDSNGAVLVYEPMGFERTVGITPAKDEGFYLTTFAEFDYLEIYQYDNDFVEIGYQAFPNVSGPGETPFQLADGDWVIFKNENSNKYQTRIDIATNTVSTKLILEQGQSATTTKLLSNGFLLHGIDYSGIGNGGTLSGLLLETDFDGNVIWKKVYDHLPGTLFFSDADVLVNGDIIISGYFSGAGTVSNISYIARANEIGEIYSNSITGNVSYDLDQNCELDIAEPVIKDWVVTATKGDQVFVNLTDEYGVYSLPLDTGTYNITIFPSNELWNSCVNDIQVVVPQINTHFIQDFSIQSVIDCPYLEISHTMPRIRSCFERPSYIDYCNNGTDTAFNAYVDIAYDSLITPVSSTLIWESLPDNVYRFQLGDIPPLACGNFNVHLFLDCSATLGASYCIEAHAYPDSICIPDSSSWNGAFLEATGFCEDDNVYLRIQNVGTNDMTEHSDYIVIEDILMLKIDSVNLGEGEFLEVPLLATGATYTLIANQVPGAPGFSNPIAIVEGCGENDMGEFTIGLSNQFAQNDENPFVDIDCVVAVGSYDPNDKQGFPIGYGPEHLILPETSLEYLIRFQNTGSDTAFTVVVRDTLDHNFDLQTFSPGSSSHGYQVDLDPLGILKFTFNNILLPDSIVDQEGSNGFVEYKITPKSSLALGTVLKNKAGIYFDFNEPIITNETFHTIGEEYINVIPSSIYHPYIDNINVLIYPNPLVDFARIKIVNHSAREYHLEIFNVDGRLQSSRTFDSNEMVINKGLLSKGIYFYRISSGDGFKNTGKIVIH